MHSGYSENRNQISEGQVKSILVWQRQYAASTTCTYLIHTHFQRHHHNADNLLWYKHNESHPHPTCAKDAADTYLSPDPYVVVKRSPWLSNWTAWRSSRGSRVCRFVLWRCLCWAVSGRRHRQSAPGGTSWPWRWCNVPWWASDSRSRGSRGARGSALRSRAGRRAQRNFRSQTGWSTPVNEGEERAEEDSVILITISYGGTIAIKWLKKTKKPAWQKCKIQTLQTKHSGCQRLLSAEM